MRRGLASAVALAACLLGAGEVQACKCLRPSGLGSAEAEQKWLLDRAGDVVRGRITDVKTIEETGRDGVRSIVATMKASAVVKGNVPLGELTIVSAYEDATSDIRRFLLEGVASNQDVALEIRKITGRKNEFTASACGYSDARAEAAR